MILKLICAAALLAAPVAASAPASPQLEQPAVPLVICPMIGGYSAGSAFRIGPHLLLSVNHVTSASATCGIDGQRITVIYASTERDFSVLSDDRPGSYLKADCGGYVAGRRYVALGHARGLPILTTVTLIATGSSRGGFYVLRGIFTVIPGMSGGPVLDAETGKVVGTINVYDEPSGMSGSVPLSETPVCKRA